MSVLVQIKQAVDLIERGVQFADSAHYYLTKPDGGGIQGRYTLEEAVDEALLLTSEKCGCPRSLVLTNTATQDLVMFYDGRAFLPAELLPVNSQTQ